MSVPAGPTIATATLQLFFAASASAGAAAFLAFSRLMAGPYGFGICATALASAPSANITAATNLTTTFCDMLSPPIQRVIASHRTRDHFEIPHALFLLTCSPPCKQNCSNRWYRPHPCTSQSGDRDRAAASSSRPWKRLCPGTSSRQSHWAQSPSPPTVRAPSPRYAVHPSRRPRLARTNLFQDHRCNVASPAPCRAARTPPTVARP